MKQHMRGMKTFHLISRYTNDFQFFSSKYSKVLYTRHKMMGKRLSVSKNKTRCWLWVWPWTPHSYSKNKAKKHTTSV